MRPFSDEIGLLLLLISNWTVTLRAKSLPQTQFLRWAETAMMFRSVTLGGAKRGHMIIRTTSLFVLFRKARSLIIRPRHIVTILQKRESPGEKMTTEAESLNYGLAMNEAKEFEKSTLTASAYRKPPPLH